MGDVTGFFARIKKNKKGTIRAKDAGVGFFKSQHEQREARKRVMFSKVDIKKANKKEGK